MAGNSSLLKLDVGVLSAEQQEKLRQFKIKTRIDNEKYLRAHPEVEVLIGDFLSNIVCLAPEYFLSGCVQVPLLDVLLKRPADIREFAADHFTNANLHVVTGSKMEGHSDME